jgi:aminopeptidase N
MVNSLLIKFMTRILAIALFTFSTLSAFSQRKIDVSHYKFYIDVNDENDTIKGEANIKLHFLENTGSFDLDIILFDGEKGMNIEKVVGEGVRGFFRVGDEKIRVMFSKGKLKGDSAIYKITYKGIPADGLIISKNKFNKRTFFSDNWPNRARHWLPCVDDPADKASVEFLVTAPDHYQVISNGSQMMVMNLNTGKKLSHWKEEEPLPTKVMVIGIADFAIEQAGMVDSIPVTSWVFPENKTQGFYDYAQAVDILKFFINYIGPYPYKKLANVQSKTIFGGMENASAIFYAEDLVTGKRNEERLIAHEIAHQWFGNMVTEQHFSHLWLSEGFATYLSHLYLESVHGVKRLNEEIINDRNQVIAFSKESQRPVVDSVSRLMDLLNANSYQKGGWVLHMLRREVGDSAFHAIIRNYYMEFAGGNATTEDFEKIASTVSNKDLTIFFDQWLYTGEIPNLEIKWISESDDSRVMLTITQLQEKAFNIPLEVRLKFESGQIVDHTIQLTEKTGNFVIETKERLKEVIVDPNVNLLAEILVL